MLLSNISAESNRNSCCNCHESQQHTDYNLKYSLWNTHRLPLTKKNYLRLIFIDVTAPVLLLCVKQNFTGSLILAAQGGYICNYICCKSSPISGQGGEQELQKWYRKKTTHFQYSGVTQRKQNSFTITNRDLSPHESLHIHVRNQNRWLLDMLRGNLCARRTMLKKGN